MGDDKRVEALKKAREVRLANLAARRAAAPVDPPPIPTRAAIPTVPVKQATDPLLGINNDDCPIDCSMERCVISGKPYCAHPKKCGLHAIDKMVPEAVQRYNRARKVLAHAEIERQS